MSDIAFSPIDPVVETLIGDKVVAHRPLFARAFGGACVGLLLSQFWFYSRMRTAEGREGWFYASQEQIEEDTGLTRTEQETARRKLRDAGVLVESKAGLPARLWYQINKGRAVEILRQFLITDAVEKEKREKKKAEDAEVRKSKTRMSAEKGQTSQQEIDLHASGKVAVMQGLKPRAITKTSPKTSLKITERSLKAAVAAPEPDKSFSSSSQEQKEPYPDPVDPEEYHKARRDMTQAYISGKSKVKSSKADWEALARERMAAKAAAEKGEDE